MEGLCHCRVACAQLGNRTGRRTVTMVARLLLTNGTARYEAVLHNDYKKYICACVRERSIHGIFSIEPDNCESILPGMQQGLCRGALG